MNARAREFKPKVVEPPKEEVKTENPPQKEFKYFTGVLPGQASRPPPTMLPPGLLKGFDKNNLPMLAEGMPEGMRKMFMKAYDDGKFDEMIMESMDMQSRINTGIDDPIHTLTLEEEEFAAEFLAEQDEIDIGPFYLNGKCKYGKKGMNFHPSDVEEISGSINFEGDREGGIGMENTLAKDRQFGLLDGGEHAFCLEGIRNWRATYIKRMSKQHMRMCPLCRKSSFLVIPSSKYLPGGPAKEQLVEEYKDTLYDIPCRHFNYGDGECPFLNSGFYSHYTKDGKRFEYGVKARYINDDGEIVIEKENDHTTLASLIGL